MLTLVDRVNIYWQEPNGQLTKVKTVLPNEKIQSVFQTKR